MLNTYFSLSFVLLAVGTTVLLTALFPPDPNDIQAAPELAGLLGGLFPGSLVGTAVARLFIAVGTPWVNRAINPVILAYAGGAGATGYACYIIGSLNPLAAAWILALITYAIAASLLAGLLLGLANLTPLRPLLRRSHQDKRVQSWPRQRRKKPADPVQPAENLPVEPAEESA